MPIIDLQRRLRAVGRIRIGEQVPTSSGKTRPAKLDRFRFTSPDKTAIMQVADLCGGEVQPWAGAPVGEQFELYADCKSLDVLVPPVDLAFSQWFELWAGSGCQRRCDGQTNVINDKPCACDPDNMECKPTTRLSVILTAIDGIGIWRLETHGWNAAQELNGAIEVLRVIQSKGAMVPARLILEQRQSKKDGQTHNFAVPVLDLNLSVAALTGGTDRPALASGVTPIPQETFTTSIREQIQATATPVVKPPRANAAATLPPTGLAPRPAAAAPIATDDGEATNEPLRTQTVASVPPQPNEPLLTEPQGKNIGRLFNKINITERADRLSYLADMFGHPFDSSKELTKREASRLISELKVVAGEEETPRQTTPRNEEPPPADPSYAEYDSDPF